LIFPAEWQRRYTVVGLSFFAVFICYIDRVNISVAIIPMSEELGWNRETQGLVLASFFVGYLLLQIIGGLLADRFGGKVVLGAGVLLWSLFTILTPPAAFVGLGILLLTRVAMGMGEAVTFPAFYSLYGRWIPTAERARAVAFTNSGVPLGTVSGLVLTPLIVSWLGWEWAFYLFGALGTLWYLAWHRKVTAAPGDDPRIDAKELSIIGGGLAEEAHQDSPVWWTFLRFPAVWAIIVAHFCNNWSLYVLLSWLPTFVSEGLGVDFHSVGWLTMVPHLTSFVFLNFAGNIADRMIARGVEVGRVRKIMQSIGFGGLAISLLIVGEVESAWAAIGVMSVGTALGAFVTGGFAVNHMDLAPRHAGTLMGITNTAGTIPGIIGVYISGLILQSTGSWALVFQLSAAVTIFGLIFFLIFASGRRIFD